MERRPAASRRAFQPDRRATLDTGRIQLPGAGPSAAGGGHRTSQKGERIRKSVLSGFVASTDCTRSGSAIGTIIMTLSGAGVAVLGQE